MSRDDDWVVRAAAVGWARRAGAPRGAPRVVAEPTARSGPFDDAARDAGASREGFFGGGPRALVSARGERAGVSSTVTRGSAPRRPLWAGAPFSLQERGPGVCELAATPPALADASPRQVPAGFAAYQNPTLDPTTYVQWTLGQWRVMLPRELGEGPSRALLRDLQRRGAYSAGLVRVGDALVPAALAPADRYALATRINLQPCGARAALANDESAA